VPGNRGGCLQVEGAGVDAPEDEHRKAALEIGPQSDSNEPLTWLALAAGWSGGLLAMFPNLPVPVPTYMTARAARIAVLLSAARVRKDQRSAHLQACVAAGMKLAETGL